jgi:DNA-directed RNA polymerase specialized sigma24 family protein
MYLIKLLSQLKRVKDFAANLLLSQPNPAIHNKLDLAVAQMSMIEGILHASLGDDKQIMDFPPSRAQTLSTVEMTDETPKNQVFYHWEHINALTERRFPHDKNLQLEASQYVLDALEAEDWKKVRAFKGKSFMAFITTVTSRLLTDFWHNKFGKQRPNTWLKRQTDPIYEKAYQLLVKEKYTKHEATEILLTIEPTPERWKIQKVVEAVRANCPLKEEYQEISLDETDEGNHAAPHASLEEQFERWNEQTLLEVLSQSINDTNDVNNPPVNQLLAFLDQSVRLTEEECLLLRLRYHTGLTVKKIGTLLDLSASQVDKRIKKALARLRKAFNQAGL